MSLEGTNHDPTKTSISDWSYVSEGGATIVFSYVGAPHPVFSHSVIRLRKAPLNKRDLINDIDEEEPDDPSIAFQNEVTALLLPAIHLPRLESVHVTREWLSELSIAAQSKRPELRKAADDIDLSRRKAVIATDLVGGKGWAVEIKVCHLKLETYLL